MVEISVRPPAGARTGGASFVKVEPTSDNYRRVIKHPSGIGFPERGGTTWPLDKFTRRRVAEGAVKIIGPA